MARRKRQPSERTSSPDRTVTKALGTPLPAPDHTAQGEQPIGGSSTTASQMPADSLPSSPRETDEGYILKEESDGRYRIIGKRRSGKRRRR